jgi:hypothetical protein
MSLPIAIRQAKSTTAASIRPLPNYVPLSFSLRRSQGRAAIKNGPHHRAIPNDKIILVVIVIAISMTMFDNDGHFVVIPVQVTIMIPVAAIDDDCSSLCLRWCRER